MANKPKVYIVGPKFGADLLFAGNGWSIVKELGLADLALFTGGEDINPAIYGHGVHKTTCYNPKRDEHEVLVAHLAHTTGTPMAGICRGAQLLNALAGGTLYQHIDGHAISGTHAVQDARTGEIWQTNSYHHQGIIPTSACEVLAYSNICTSKEFTPSPGLTKVHMYPRGTSMDVEVFHYPKKKLFGFQGHPEFGLPKSDLARRFFGYLEDCLHLHA